jgi:hypothetical protein
MPRLARSSDLEFVESASLGPVSVQKLAERSANIGSLRCCPLLRSKLLDGRNRHWVSARWMSRSRPHSHTDCFGTRLANCADDL